MNRKQKKATTLVEAILYAVLLAIFMLAAVMFALQIIGLTSVSENMDEFQSNQTIILQKISDSIYTAESIDTDNSVFDDDNGVLSLIMEDEEKSPTQFFLTENNMFMQEGEADPIQLNTNDTKIDYLNFKKISFSKAPDQIVIDMQISPISNDLSYDKQELPLHISLSLRNL